MDLVGDYYAPELIDPETLEPREGKDREHHFVLFGLRLEEISQRRRAGPNPDNLDLHGARGHGWNDEG